MVTWRDLGEALSLWLVLATAWPLLAFLIFLWPDRRDPRWVEAHLQRSPPRQWFDWSPLECISFLAGAALVTAFVVRWFRTGW